jgi:hypothetical protein
VNIVANIVCISLPKMLTMFPDYVAKVPLAKPCLEAMGVSRHITGLAT